jgi:hypothetical protein
MAQDRIEWCEFALSYELLGAMRIDNDDDYIPRMQGSRHLEETFIISLRNLNR